MDATLLTSRVTDAKARLASLAPLTKAKLENGDPEFLAEAFGLLALADLNAVALEAAHPDQAFGFHQYDARFLRSMRDQVMGVGQAAKPLTKAQLRTARTILLREQYTTQLALLLPH